VRISPGSTSPRPLVMLFISADFETSTSSLIIPSSSRRRRISAAWEPGLALPLTPPDSQMDVNPPTFLKMCHSSFKRCDLVHTGKKSLSNTAGPYVHGPFAKLLAVANLDDEGSGDPQGRAFRIAKAGCPHPGEKWAVKSSGNRELPNSCLP
jgi:hypothetical protein